MIRKTKQINNKITTKREHNRYWVASDENYEVVLSNMTENATNIKILKVAHVLQQKLVYLTGGRDKEEHPLVICNAINPAFVATDEIKAAARYLLHTASLLWAEDTKFVVLLNCQTSKWNHAKAFLQLLESCFAEEQIHHVLLLKPQSFLQRHFGSNDSKQIKVECPFEIVYFDSCGILLDHFDQTQLPDEYGGIDGFNIVEWVEYTTAIERFQHTCHKVKQRLDDVEKLFADKFPQSNVSDIELLQKQQDQLVEDITNDIECATEIAETLSPIVNKPLSHSLREQSPLERYNSAQFTVSSERLGLYNGRLEKIWQEQKIYLTQAKELCQFEEKFSEVSQRLLQITSILDARIDIGDSLRSAKDLMLELDDFERKQKDSYKEMMILKEKGLTMLALFGSFAQVSIKYRCEEIKILCKDFEVKLEARRELLQVSLDVFVCLDLLEKWCKTGVDLLAAQPVESFNTEVGAKICLNEIDNFIKNGQGINMKKMNQLDTLCKKLEQPSINAKVEEALKRINDVKSMLEKREASLKKVAMKPVRPIQPVKALVIKEDEAGVSPISPKKTSSVKTPTGFKTPMYIPPPSPAVKKDEIEIVVTDDIEKYKRNKTFRKSLRMSVKRPVSSPAQLQMAEYEEDADHRKKIRHVITELMNTEEDYVNDLKFIVEGYYAEFDDLSFDIPQDLRKNKEVIFGNIVNIYDFHNNLFLEELRKCKDAPYLAGQMFMDKKEKFQLYAEYCKNKPKSEALRIELHKTSFLKECQKKLGHQLNLDSYLLKPVQRVTKYRLLLTEMLKYTSKRNPAHADILDALHTMKTVLRHVNDVMHSSGINGFSGNLEHQGKLLHQDTFSVWETKKNSIKPFTKLGCKQRQVFLFEKSIIFSKKEYDNGRELGTYLSKVFLNTADIGVTETVRGDECRFEIWVQGKNEAYIMQAVSLEVKNNWLNEIRKLLMLQFEGVKETIKRKGSRDELECTISRQDLKNKLNFLDSSLSSSQPILNITDDSYTAANGVKLSNPSFRMAMGAPRFNKSNSENMLANDDSDDSAWSDSEFDEDENAANNNVIQNEVADIKQHYEINVEKSPTQVTGSSGGRFVAIADYSSFEHSEIIFEEGDLFDLIREGDAGWWYCKHLKTQTEGWVPSGYLELYIIDVTNGLNNENEEVASESSEETIAKLRLETAV